jgi:tetratricopeptide (TPR) repeat protein
MMAKNPRSFVFLPLGNTCIQAGRLKLANEVINRGLSYYPKLNSALLAKARILLARDRSAEAEKIINIVLERDPVNFLAKKLMAETCLNLGKPDEGLACLDSVRREAPKKNIRQKLYEMLLAQKAGKEKGVATEQVFEEKENKVINTLERWLNKASKMTIKE